jgi:RHS repeat-associated protein
MTDRRGMTTTYTYDSLNRRISETYADGATVTRQFDAAGRVITENDSVAGVFQNVWDVTGNLTQRTTPFGSTTYTRDAIFEVTSRQVTGQNPVSYTFDPRRFVTKIGMGSNTIQFTYDARGGVTGIARSNGVSSANVFDPVGNVTGVRHTNGGTALDTEAIGYDPLNNVTSVSRTIGQALTTPSATATYDTAGRVTAFGSRTITSDNNGNRVADASAGGTTTYTWDARNRLTAMQVPASGTAPALTVSYLYDPQGNLIQRSVTTAGSGNVTSEYLLDEKSNVVYQGTVNGEQLNMLTGTRYDQQYGVVGSAGTIGFALHDYFGSVVGNTNQTGSLAGQNDYEPFGQTTQTGTAYPFAYGARIQAVSNLYNFRARYYDPTTGSFISEDPAGLKADFNFYRYGYNNPLTFGDPLGEGFSFGGQGSAIAEAGGISGVSAQGSVGVGAFFGDNGASVGAWSSTGGFVGVPGAGYNYAVPGSGGGGAGGGVGSGCGGAVIGAVASAGGGVWVSNAGKASDLGGNFNQFNFNAGVGPVKIGFSFAWSGATTWWNPFSGTWIASVSPPAWGETAGIGASFYKTNTWGTASSRTVPY